VKVGKWESENCRKWESGKVRKWDKDFDYTPWLTFSSSDESCHYRQLSSLDYYFHTFKSLSRFLPLLLSHFQLFGGRCPLRRAALVFVVLLLALGGCGGKQADFQLSPADVEKLQPILDELRLGYDFTQTLEAEMIVTIEEKGEKEEVREYLWYKKSKADGDLLHIQAMGVYNEPRVVVIAARKQFLLYMVNEGEAILEPLEDQVLREIFGMDVRVSDVRSAIFANPFLEGDNRELALTRSGVKYVVKRPGAEAESVEEITIFVRDSEPQVADWAVRNGNDEVVQSVKFSDYRDIGGVLKRPHKVEIERPGEQTRVTLKIANPKINTEVSDAKFRFDFLPEDTKFRRVERTDDGF
jgi:outer membrane lipoprotein-sorting protein